MKKAARIYIAGHTGVIGSALTRHLASAGYRNVIVRTHKDADLTDRSTVEQLFRQEKPEYVFLAAGKVGGIKDNMEKPAEYFRENFLIATNLIHVAHQAKVRKFMFLACSCLFPKACDQPMKEDALWTGPLEPTNAAYATAKLAGLEMCRAYRQQYKEGFIIALPSNVYGMGDRLDEGGHVVANLMKRFHEAKQDGAKEVTLWGSGSPKREFLFVDDLAEALVFLMERYDSADPINVGTGKATTIRELAELLQAIVGFKGRIVYDTSRPDGAAERFLDSSRMSKLGWKAKTPLKEGLKKMYAWYQETANRSCPA